MPLGNALNKIPTARPSTSLLNNVENAIPVMNSMEINVSRVSRLVVILIAKLSQMEFVKNVLKEPDST